MMCMRQGTLAVVAVAEGAWQVSLLAAARQQQAAGWQDDVITISSTCHGAGQLCMHPGITQAYGLQGHAAAAAPAVAANIYVCDLFLV